MAWENICKPEISKSEASSFNEIERGLFVYSSLVENMENQNLSHLSAQYTTESKNNQSEEYTIWSIDNSFNCPFPQYFPILCSFTTDVLVTDDTWAADLYPV